MRAIEIALQTDPMGTHGSGSLSRSSEQELLCCEAGSSTLPVWNTWKCISMFPLNHSSLLLVPKVLLIKPEGEKLLVWIADEQDLIFCLEFTL